MFMLLMTNSYAQKYPFYNLTVDNGLIQSQVSCMAQDSKGNLWIGTIGGLSRYDGQGFTNYSIKDGMVSNEVRALTIDSSGNIWIKDAVGVSEFNGKKFKHFVVSTSFNTSPNRQDEIKIGKGDTIWCNINGEVYFIAKGKSNYFSIPGSHARATSIFPDNSGIWVATSNGTIYRYHGKERDSIKFKLPDGRAPYVFCFYKDHKGTMFLGTGAGLYTIQTDSVLPFALKQSYRLPPVLSIAEDKNNSLWLGVNGGALRITGDNVEVFNKQNGLSDNIFNCVLADKEGNIWLGSDGQGLFRYSGAAFTTLDESVGLPSAQITAIASGINGRLYLGTYDEGLFAFENGKVSPIRFPSGVKPMIFATKVINGRLWIGTRGLGLWQCDGYDEPIAVDNGILPQVITCLYSDSWGHLWIGSVDGFSFHSKDRSINYRLNNTIVYDIASIGKDSMLLATSRGLRMFNGDTTFAYLTNTVLDSTTVQCFTIIGDVLWAGTSDNGIIAYNLKTGHHNYFNKQTGLQSDFIYNIISDDYGNIWAGTGYGIHQIYQEKNGRYSIRFYGKAQGIGGMESNLNTVLKMKDGSIWFGTTNGAAHYQPNSYVVVPRPVSIVMESVKLFGQEVIDSSYYDSVDTWYNVPYNLRLPYQKNNISFTFQGISLSGSGQVFYRYVIEGIDAGWSNWSKVNSVTYSALPPGKYVFRVQCRVGFNDSSLRVLSYPFEIITPFEKTGLFRLLILAGCILLGISIQYIVNHREQNRIKLLERLRSEEQAKIRLRTAEDFHDEVGNKLTRINVLANVLLSKIDNITPDIKRLLEQIKDNTGQLYSGTRDILWSLQPSNDSLYEILLRIRDFGNELLNDTDVEFNMTGIDPLWKQFKLPMDMSRNLIMIFKEALNNSLKYSGAKHVKLEVELNHDVLSMILIDDGKGFDVLIANKGHGLGNMNVRAQRLGGKLHIDSSPTKGTIITLKFHITIPK
jgi:signal transduction histidine kinase/ligand-binding sensor domain-containing protein